MSPPDAAAKMCDVAQSVLQAVLLDGDEPATGAAAAAWAHVAQCDRCGRALANDRALRRALERLRHTDRATDSLRERVQRVIAERGRRGNGSRPS